MAKFAFGPDLPSPPTPRDLSDCSLAGSFPDLTNLTALTQLYVIAYIV